MSHKLGDAVLKSKDGREIKASELWEGGPVLVVCLRRPGCRECDAAAPGPTPFVAAHPGQSPQGTPPPPPASGCEP
jgi:hypothetical protein